MSHALSWKSFPKYCLQNCKLSSVPSYFRVILNLTFLIKSFQQAQVVEEIHI